MKKLFLAAAFALVSVASFAQAEVGSLIIRPKVGLNVANLTNQKADPRIGLVLGAEAEYQMFDIVSVSAGLFYSVQGAKTETVISGGFLGQIGGGKATAKFDYINIPILAQVYVAQNLAVKLGIQPAFNVKGTMTHGNISLDDQTKAFDFSIPVGVSYQLDRFVIDARYNFGTSNAVKIGNSKNSVFQFTLGYNFEL